MSPRSWVARRCTNPAFNNPAGHLSSFGVKSESLNPDVKAPRAFTPPLVSSSRLCERPDRKWSFFSQLVRLHAAREQNVCAAQPLRRRFRSPRTSFGARLNERCGLSWHPSAPSFLQMRTGCLLCPPRDP